MMKTFGVEITEEQIAAGKDAMKGTFRCGDVEAALLRAGVPAKPMYLAHRTADKLLQSERRKGMISTNPANKREWIAA